MELKHICKWAQYIQYFNLQELINTNLSWASHRRHSLNASNANLNTYLDTEVHGRVDISVFDWLWLMTPTFSRIGGEFTADALEVV